MKLRNGLTLCAAALLSAAPAFAGFNQGDFVTLNNQPAFRVAACDGFSATHRAWITQDRLDNALFLSADKSPSAVSINRINGALIVQVGGRNVITADSNSAREAGLSPQQLAEKWAGKIRNFLADSTSAMPYIAALKRPNPLAADVSIVERKLYAPAGTVLPITFQTAINSETVKVGDRVEGLLSRDVMLGHYAIPSGSQVIGEIVERRPGEFGVTLSTLRLKSGTEFPIAASVVDSYTVATSSARPVCTMGMPANEKLGCRVPATIGIGAVGGDGAGTTTLVLRQDTSRVIAVGQPFSVVLDSVTPVAVVTRSHAM